MLERFYYTFNELLDEETLTGFKKLFDTFEVPFTDTSYTTELFGHIEEAYGQDFCLYVDVEHPAWEEVEQPTVAELLADAGFKSQALRFIKKIKNWLDDSQFRYEKLISIYTAEQTHLLDKVQTVSTSQYNDTPQTTATGLDADNYATSYTKNASSSDMLPVINRLNEIRIYWSSLYNEWANEFGKKFVLYN